MVRSWLDNVSDARAYLNVYYEGDINQLSKDIGWEHPDDYKGFVTLHSYDTAPASHFRKIIHPHESSYVYASTNSPEYDNKLMFKMHASRFCHKIFALDQHMGGQLKWPDKAGSYVGWIDADTVVHTEIEEGFFDSLVDEDTYMSYLARTERHSECGFLLFNTDHWMHPMYWKDMTSMFYNFKLIYEKEWHDSYLFDVVRKTFDHDAFKKIHEIDKGDVFGQSVLGQYMTHYKGPQTVGK